MSLTTPKQPWPVWLPAVTRLHFGIPATKPPGTPKIRKDGWVDLLVWQPFERWNAWIDAGKPAPRPKDVWVKVPSWASTGEPDFSPWKLRGERYRQAHSSNPPPKPKPPGPTATPAKWPTVKSETAGRNGLYFYNWPGRLGEARIITLAQQLNLWVAILVNELDRTPMRNDAPIPDGELAGIRDRLKAADVTAVATGWADPGYDLDAQAHAIGRLARGWDEYMLNIEAAWAWQGSPATAGFLTSERLAPKVRDQLGPDAPLSVCIDWGNAIHFRPWLQAGTSTFRVQCYLNEWPHKTPKGALDLLRWPQADLPDGVPAGMGEIVYGRYGSGATDAPLALWTPQDDEAGRPPRSSWAAEFNDEPDIAWIAR